MQRPIYYITLLFLLLIAPLNTFAEGLRFRSAPNIKDERCRYEVFNYEQPTFKKSLDIKFDLRIENPQTFGNIARIRLSENSDILNIFYSYENENYSTLKLNIEGQKNIFTQRISGSKLKNSEWIKIGVHCDLGGKTTTLSVDDQTQTNVAIKHSNRSTPSIVFGCNLPGDDAAEFSIRNLRVYDSTSEFLFPLNEVAGNEVLDVNLRSVGYVENPIWVDRNSYYWSDVFNTTIDGVSAICVDNNSSINIVTEEHLYIYNTHTKEFSEHEYSNPIPIDIKLGTCFYDSATSSIYVYEINGLPEGATTVAKLDMSSLEWESVSTQSLPTQRHHHTSLFMPDRLENVIFGGFGNRQFNSDFTAYSTQNNSWEDIVFSGDSIPPRLFSCSIIAPDNSLYIWGGKGNITGDQTIGTEYYYDLYQVDLEGHYVEKIWEIEPPAQNMAPVRSGIISKDAQSFYTLCYNIDTPQSKLQLYNFSIQSGEYTVVSDTISVRSDNILSNSNMFLDSVNSKIYCYIQEYTPQNSSNIRVYTINFPPVGIKQAVSSDSESLSLLIYVAIVILCAIFVIVLMKRCELKSSRDLVKQLEKKSSNDSTPTPNSIYLFGEFKVYDTKGYDITHLFSKKIQQLFLLILCESYSKSSGIHSNSIHEKLWGYKEMHQGKNLRGVALNRLRNTLSLLDGASIVHSEGLYRCCIEEPINCDYHTYMEITSRVNRGETLSEEQINTLYRLISRGGLLSHLFDELFDDVKQQFENFTTKYLVFDLSTRYNKKEYKKTIEYASKLTKIDPTNEIVLWYELHSLVKLNKKSESKKRFYSFTTAYSQNMGESYPLDYSDFMQSTPKL